MWQINELTAVDPEKEIVFKFARVNGSLFSGEKDVYLCMNSVNKQNGEVTNTNSRRFYYVPAAAEQKLRELVDLLIDAVAPDKPTDNFKLVSQFFTENEQ